MMMMLMMMIAMVMMVNDDYDDDEDDDLMTMMMMRCDITGLAVGSHARMQINTSNTEGNQTTEYNISKTNQQITIDQHLITGSTIQVLLATTQSRQAWK